jgi:hypothetical protein
MNAVLQCLTLPFDVHFEGLVLVLESDSVPKFKEGDQAPIYMYLRNRGLWSPAK